MIKGARSTLALFNMQDFKFTWPMQSIVLY